MKEKRRRCGACWHWSKPKPFPGLDVKLCRKCSKSFMDFLIKKHGKEEVKDRIQLAYAFQKYEVKVGEDKHE